MKKLIFIVLTVITLFACAVTMTSCEPDPDATLTYKPIICFYPEEEINCSVKIDLNGAFTCTYPEYKNGWENFTAKPDGTLVFPDGNEYYALYREARQNNEYDFSKGFCVKGSETAEFLSDVLPRLGLTAREVAAGVIISRQRASGLKTADICISSFTTRAWKPPLTPSLLLKPQACLS